MAMILSFHPCFVADQQIILGSRRLDEEDRALIREAKIILLPQTCSLSLYQACKTGSPHLFPNYDIRFQYPGKVGQHLLFKKFKCLQPETIPWPTVEAFRRADKGKPDFPHRMPFLLKRNRGHEGEGITLISDMDTLKTSLENLSRLETSGSKGFVSQELIPSGGNALRVVIMGGRSISYWKRPLDPGQMITTLSRGARIDISWRKDLMEKGEEAARKFSLITGINLAAVDFVFSLDEPEPTPYFLEINYYFGRRGLGGSGNYYRLLFQTIREWIKEQGLDPERVRLV